MVNVSSADFFDSSRNTSYHILCNSNNYEENHSSVP